MKTFISLSLVSMALWQTSNAQVNCTEFDNDAVACSNADACRILSGINVNPSLGLSQVCVEIGTCDSDCTQCEDTVGGCEGTSRGDCRIVTNGGPLDGTCQGFQCQLDCATCSSANSSQCELSTAEPNGCTFNISAPEVCVANPSLSPTQFPTLSPTIPPTTLSPTSAAPTLATPEPTSGSPTMEPTAEPTLEPIGCICDSVSSDSESESDSDSDSEDFDISSTLDPSDSGSDSDSSEPFSSTMSGSDSDSVSESSDSDSGEEPCICDPSVSSDSDSDSADSGDSSDSWSLTGVPSDSDSGSDSGSSDSDEPDVTAASSDSGESGSSEDSVSEDSDSDSDSIDSNSGTNSTDSDSADSDSGDSADSSTSAISMSDSDSASTSDADSADSDMTGSDSLSGSTSSDSAENITFVMDSNETFASADGRRQRGGVFVQEDTAWSAQSTVQFLASVGTLVAAAVVAAIVFCVWKQRKLAKYHIHQAIDVGDEDSDQERATADDIMAAARVASRGEHKTLKEQDCQIEMSLDTGVLEQLGEEQQAMSAYMD